MELRKKKIIDDAKEREALAFKYSARYGQHPETEARYRDAILACKDIDNLSLTISEIARMYGLHPEPFRNQLKRHFPEILASRRELRAKLGYPESGNTGLKEKTVQQYALAVELLRNPSVTVREAASRTGVSYHGLQQHLIFYHKDIADARMLVRTDALLRPMRVGECSANGGRRMPRPEAEAKYAPAVELYRTTDLPMTEIARRCGVAVHNLSDYIARWHRPLMEERQERRKRQLEAKRNMPPGEVRSRSVLAQRKYAPALERIASGQTISQAARELGVPVWGLASWLKLHHPDAMEAAQAGMMRLPSGKMVLRRGYNKYVPIADYINAHPTKPTREVAAKWGVPESSLCKKMNSCFPEIWAQHCRACAGQREMTATAKIPDTDA